MVEPGKEVTIIITPDYGYRIKAVTINQQLKGNLNSYKFIMPSINTIIVVDFELDI